MKHTISLKFNHVFRRLYAKGRSGAAPALAMYCRRNHLGVTRLGITVGGKLGNAVVRNRIRRRVHESYRVNEARFRPGYDIVVVARQRATAARYREIERDLLRLAKKLELLASGDGR